MRSIKSLPRTQTPPINGESKRTLLITIMSNGHIIIRTISLKDSQVKELRVGINSSFVAQKVLTISVIGSHENDIVLVIIVISIGLDGDLLVVG